MIKTEKASNGILKKVSKEGCSMKIYFTKLVVLLLLITLLVSCSKDNLDTSKIEDDNFLKVRGITIENKDDFLKKLGIANDEQIIEYSTIEISKKETWIKVITDSPTKAIQTKLYTVDNNITHLYECQDNIEKITPLEDGEVLLECSNRVFIIKDGIVEEELLVNSEDAYIDLVSRTDGELSIIYTENFGIPSLGHDV